MSNFVKFSVDTILYSIVNPRNLLTFLDSDNPYTFTDFLKYTDENYDPTVYNDFYLFYVGTWYKVKNKTTNGQQDFIAQQYISLIKEITINYSTNDERRFLSNINFNDPSDLEIAIPFYSRKIKEIILFFKSKREITSGVYKNLKRKGTVTGVEKAIKNNLLDFLFGDQLFINSGYDFNSVKNILEIEVEDLVDTFGEYFNLNSTPTQNEPDLRSNFYTANYNEIDSNLFLNFDQYLLTTIFKNTFLTSLGVNFSVNINLTYDPFCDPASPLGELIKSKTVGGVSPTDKVTLQQRLLEKFMGVDLYYITRDSQGAVLSGVLVKAQNPSGNLLNVTNPSTATIPSFELQALKKLGLYFRPDNLGVLKFDTRRKFYSFNFDTVKQNAVYVFPDPQVYGGVQYTTETPVIYEFDYSNDIKYTSSTFSYGDPKIETKDQPFYGYFTRQQQKNSYLDNNITPDFSALANKGYIYNWQTDIYGNQYALYKSGYLQGIQQPQAITSSVVNDTGILQHPIGGRPFDTIVQGSSTVFSAISPDYNYITPIDKYNTLGAIYVNSIGGNLQPLSASLYSTFSKYTSGVQTEIYNAVKTLNIVYDTITIETQNYFVIDKINFDGSSFIKSTQANTYVTINSASKFESFSNRVFLKNNNHIYFYVTRLYPSLSATYDKIVYPEIYSYDVTTYKLKKLFPIRQDEITNLASIFSHNVLFNQVELNYASINLVELVTPTLGYNSYNNLFNITWICKDENNSPYIFNYNFNLQSNNITFINSKVYSTSSKVQDTNTTNTRGYFKLTTNFFATSTNEIPVVPSTPLPANYLGIDPNYQFLDFNSVINTSALINMSQGVLVL